MDYEPFSDQDIRDGLKQVCEHAIASCAKKFNAQLRTGRKQGLENIFESAFLQSFEKKVKDWSTRKQVNRAEFHTASSERDGRVDVVATYDKVDGRKEKVGIEFKVCELPRNYANGPDGVTYDIGQIAWDFGELATYHMEFGYCIAVIHGGIPSMKAATKKGVARAFHNALFVDAETHRHFGKSRTGERKYDVRYMRSVLPDMGLDKPYFDGKAHRGNFCILDKKNRLAVVGLFVPRKTNKPRKRI